MQLKSAVCLAALCIGATLSTPSAAGICVLAVAASGTFALSSDGRELGSGQPGGSAALVSITSVGSSTVTVGSPSLTQYPAAFNPGTASVEVSYAGSALLSAVTQSYTGQETAFGIPNLITPVIVTINNRILTNSGFAPGTYQSRTVVTCS